MMNENQQKQSKDVPALHPAEAACSFMTRTTLNGGEVDVYARTYNWLQSILTGEIVLLTSTDFDQLQTKVNDLELAAAAPEDPEPELEDVDSEIHQLNN